MANTLIEGTVARVSKNGLQLAEQPGQWLNVSRFAAPDDVRVPPPGTRVNVTVDAQGWVRRIAPATNTASANGHTPSAPASAPAGRPGREIVIARLATINSAIALLASGGRQVDLEIVLEVAGRLESWAIR